MITGRVLIRPMELWRSLKRLSGRASYESIDGMKNEHDREPTPDETAGMVWWNSLAESDRAAWLARADSAVPADAWATYQRLGDGERQPRTVN
ncbi:MAG: hypothetical protein EOQ42_24755 [Mesorhizobium sp.]|nr:MAG: hypothetical protein EOQ42_24755 [Mesorhizobium sp.]